ncbi:hypothetical protein PGB90_010157 [Kerria lacca]
MENKSKDQFYSPPPERSIGEQIMQFLWNSETNQFLGRTFGSWAKIILFYIIFYLVLAAFWGGMWIIFNSIAIKTDKPRFTLQESLIGSNPGLGYRPMPSEEYIDSALIWFKQSDNGFVNWTNKLQTFLEPYEKIRRDPNESKNYVNCSYDYLPPPNKVCRVPLEQMAPCDKQFYRYDSGGLCIFLKLNKIFDWIPQYYNDVKSFPSNMPKELQEKIKDEGSKNPKNLNTVWVSCEGENPSDKEHIGPIYYFPRPGFPGYYFPFSNVKGYLSPLVAVWFKNPIHGVLINVECKAWAKNIIYDRHDRKGSVHFELMID